MQIYLIRHTRPDVALGTCYGQTDLSLAFTFQKELKLIKEILPDPKTYTIYSSPLKRCLSLAQSLSNQVESILVDPRIMELNFGDWEMKKWIEVKEESSIWSKDFVNSAPPNGETFQLLYNRSLNFIKELIESPINQAMVISHSGVMHSLLTYFLEMPLRKAYTLKIDYGQVIKITVIEDNHFQVEFLGSAN